MKDQLRVWSRAAGSNQGCGQGMERHTEGMVQGWRVTLRSWSRAGVSHSGCGPGLE